MSGSKVLQMPGVSELPRSTPKTQKSAMETLYFTLETIESWKRPPFQRPFKANAKVLALVEELKKNGGFIPGVITLGDLNGVRYLLDGQHRIEAFKMSGLDEGIANMRVCTFETMSAMADEFVELNGSLVPFKADDLLRALESSSPELRKISRTCPFIGYGFIGKGGKVISMGAALRMWYGSKPEVPTTGGLSTTAIVEELNEEEVERMCEFFTSVHAAWGSDPEYHRLWGGLNVGLCAWLWRRTVMGQYSGKTLRLTKDMFRKCAMALSANSKYLDWLVGRQLKDRDRSPGLARLRAIFLKRLDEEGHGKVYFPKPDWFTYGGRKSDQAIIE